MAIEHLTEEVATNLEEVAEVTRKLNTVGLGYFAVGLGIGAAVGFYFGYKFNRAKIYAEVYAESREEVDQIRQVYLEKTLENAGVDKPSPKEVVERLGYSLHVEEEHSRPLPAPVPITSHERLKMEIKDLPESPKDTSKSMHEGWNYELELKSRTPEAPYVIHQNEYNHSNAEYSKVVYTYYAIDDVVANSEDERPVPHADAVIGWGNLKFGHGSDDADVVYVRNDPLEIDMQICRINQSFEEEVLGISRDDDED